jgi:hypothetical protein
VAAHLHCPCWLIALFVLPSPVLCPAARGGEQDLAKRAKVAAESRIQGEQADARRMVDGDLDTWWSTGPGDLGLEPLDVDIVLAEPRVVDALIVTTTTMKGQLRLTDFDLFGGLGGAWDGAHPLAQVRRNASRTIRVGFPAVRVDRTTHSRMSPSSSCTARRVSRREK